MHFGSREKQLLGVQHRSGAGGLDKRGSRALGSRGCREPDLENRHPHRAGKVVWVCLFGLVFSKVSALFLCLG